MFLNALSCFAVYFYNFAMPDFGVSSLVGIIDGVKVLAFAVREGRVAVHCHAGLGRTGRNQHASVSVCTCRVCSLFHPRALTAQACWSPVTWSTPCASAQARPSTTCGSSGLAPSRPGHRSARCLTSLACSALSWSSTQTSACGTEPPSPCSITWTDSHCCCTARRDAPSDRHQRWGLRIITLHWSCAMTVHDYTAELLFLSDCHWTVSSGGVPPVCAHLLPGPGSPCTSRGASWAGEEVSPEDPEQDCEGDPGGQTVLALAEGGSEGLVGGLGVGVLLGRAAGILGEEERRPAGQTQLQRLWPQQDHTKWGQISHYAPSSI